MYKKYYQKFLEGHKNYIHLAAHSHHFWPDCTLEAVQNAWMDASKYSDKKWDKIFNYKLPQTQNIIAKILNLSSPEQIAFAPNTHELLSRVLSCFLGQEKIKILTTNCEFHSFRRQLDRIKEFKQVEVIELDAETEYFEDDFISHISEDLDLIFISQVFYNSGKVLSPQACKKIASTKADKTIFCLDGYHGFCAIPTDLKEIENDVFYISGGYKYAQAGEGMCFMSIPKDCSLRPVYTGWFADFAGLESTTGEVNYSDDGFRFWGSTQDLTSLYRFNSVWEMFMDAGLDIEKIDKYIKSLQTQFINNLAIADQLIEKDLSKLGHFYTWQFKSCEDAKEAHDWLKSEGIITDYRNHRLRFGFGLYLDQDDISKAKNIINQKYL